MNNGWSIWYAATQILKEQWKVLVIAVFLGALAGGMMALRQPTAYTARSEIVTGTYSLPVNIGTQSVVDKAGPLGLELPAETQSRIIASPAISALAAEALQLSPTDEASLAASVQASPTTGNSFAISAAGSTAAQAAANANAVANAYLKYRADVGTSELTRLAQQAKGQASASTAAAKAMEKSIASALDKNPNYASTLLTRQQQLEEAADTAADASNSLTAMSLNFTGGGSVLRPASASTASESTGLLIWVGIGLLAGAAVGISIAALRRQVSDRIMDRQDVVRAAGIPNVFAGPSAGLAGGQGLLILRSLDKTCAENELSTDQVLLLPLSAGPGRILGALMIAKAEADQGRSVAIASLAESVSGELVSALVLNGTQSLKIREMTVDGKALITKQIHVRPNVVVGTVPEDQTYGLVLLAASPHTGLEPDEAALPKGYRGAVVLVVQAGEDRAHELDNAVKELRAANHVVAAVVLMPKTGRMSKQHRVEEPLLVPNLWIKSSRTRRTASSHRDSIEPDAPTAENSISPSRHPQPQSKQSR